MYGERSMRAIVIDKSGDDYQVELTEVDLEQFQKRGLTYQA